MASININKHIKSSLEFVHRGTVVFLRYFGPFSNQRLFKASTLVCATEQAFVSNKDHTEKSEVQQRPCQKNSEWCSRHFPKFWSEEMWPPLFPDLNPIDFCVWSLLETKACSVAHTCMEAYKRSLVWEWAKIPQKYYRAAVDEFQRRLDMFIDVKGGHIKKWGYRLILTYISYYTVYFFYLCIFWFLNKAKISPRTFYSLCITSINQYSEQQNKYT